MTDVPLQLDEQAAAPPPMRTSYRYLRMTAGVLFRAFFNGRVFGVEKIPNTGGVLLLSNHQSFLDPVLATVAIPRECHYMARDTLFEKPRFRQLIEHLNAFPVKRGKADMRAIKETIRRLKEGGVLLGFPEATRTTDGSIGEMRAGLILVARKTRVPIVPTLIQGAFESWPRDAKFPRRHPIVVAYDDPFRPHELPDWDDDRCVAHVRNRLLALQDQYREPTLLC
jgi:1-acyl-sn-glycerol-3-phosphate acyltransferase